MKKHIVITDKEGKLVASIICDNLDSTIRDPEYLFFEGEYEEDS